MTQTPMLLHRASKARLVFSPKAGTVSLAALSSSTPTLAGSTLLAPADFRSPQSLSSTSSCHFPRAGYSSSGKPSSGLVGSVASPNSGTRPLYQIGILPVQPSGSWPPLANPFPPARGWGSSQEVRFWHAISGRRFNPLANQLTTSARHPNTFRHLPASPFRTCHSAKGLALAPVAQSHIHKRLGRSHPSVLTPGRGSPSRGHNPPSPSTTCSVHLINPSSGRSIRNSSASSLRPMHMNSPRATVVEPASGSNATAGPASESINGADETVSCVRETTFRISPTPGEGEEGDFPTAFRPRPDLSLVVLNFELPPFTHLLWEQAGGLRVCADGGANRLFDSLPLLFPNEDPDAVRSRFVPHVIKGDLDSIRPEVMQFYKDKGAEVFNLSEDQDTTDLHKCILHILAHHSKGDDHCTGATGTRGKVHGEEDSEGLTTAAPEHAPALEIVAVGGLGGRVDHEWGNVNVLHRFQGTRITLLSAYCTLTLLRANTRHVIRPDRGFEGPHCGLVPVCRPSRGTSTTGLRWNLDNLEMEFGGLVSTSNQIVADEITVESDVPLLWTTEIRTPDT